MSYCVVCAVLVVCLSVLVIWMYEFMLLISNVSRCECVASDAVSASSAEVIGECSTSSVSSSDVGKIVLVDISVSCVRMNIVYVCVRLGFWCFECRWLGVSFLCHVFLIVFCILWSAFIDLSDDRCSCACCRDV